MKDWISWVLGVALVCGVFTAVIVGFSKNSTQASANTAQTAVNSATTTGTAP